MITIEISLNGKDSPLKGEMTAPDSHEATALVIARSGSPNGAPAPFCLQWVGWIDLRSACYAMRARLTPSGARSAAGAVM